MEESRVFLNVDMHVNKQYAYPAPKLPAFSPGSNVMLAVYQLCKKVFISNPHVPGYVCVIAVISNVNHADRQSPPSARLNSVFSPLITIIGEASSGKSLMCAIISNMCGTSTKKHYKSTLLSLIFFLWILIEALNAIAGNVKCRASRML